MHTHYMIKVFLHIYLYLINMSSFLTFLGSQPWGPLEHLMSITQWHEMNLKMELFTSCTSCIISHHYHSRSQIYFRIFKERVDWALNLCRKSSALSTVLRYLAHHQLFFRKNKCRVAIYMYLIVRSQSWCYWLFGRFLFSQVH